jgi:hypothetical protein
MGGVVPKKESEERFHGGLVVPKMSQNSAFVRARTQIPFGNDNKMGRTMDESGLNQSILRSG